MIYPLSESANHCQQTKVKCRLFFVALCKTELRTKLINTIHQSKQNQQGKKKQHSNGEMKTTQARRTSKHPTTSCGRASCSIQDVRGLALYRRRIPNLIFTSNN